MISITQTHFKKCSVTVKSNNNDCAVICNIEQEHNPRPIMHQACVHECSSAFFSESDIGCHYNSIEDTLREVALFNGKKENARNFPKQKIWITTLYETVNNSNMLI